MRRLIPSATAAFRITPCSAPTSTVIVSKNPAGSTVNPRLSSPFASRTVLRWIRCAIARSPSGPWKTAYIDAITASSACAVQTFEVAFSRRMCCSRVCRLSRYARLPRASIDTPTIRPGIDRFSSSFTAM